jgi:hypothetical protein
VNDDYVYKKSYYLDPRTNKRWALDGFGAAFTQDAWTLTARATNIDDENGNTRTTFDVIIPGANKDAAGLLTAADKIYLDGSFQKANIYHGNNEQDMPSTPSDQFVVSASLAKAYTDAETVRATNVEADLQTQVSARELLSNKDNVIEKEPAVLIAGHYPTTQAVRDYVKEAINIYDNDYIYRANIFESSDNKRWVMNVVDMMNSEGYFDRNDKTYTFRFISSNVAGSDTHYEQQTTDITIASATQQLAGL